jgi:RNA polymerase sigma-70 factor (ECF subfamily)
VRGAVVRCQQGDPQAFRQIFEDHVSGVYRHLTLLIGPGPDVDDLTQLVFLNVFQSIKRFKGQSTFATWLFRITANIAHQEIRAKGRQKRLGSAVNDLGKARTVAIDLTPERSLSTVEQIYGVLDQLSWKKRETFILHTYEGYSLEEIAQLLDSSVSTVGSRLQSARREIIRILNVRRGR